MNYEVEAYEGELRELRRKVKVLESVLDMVEDNTRMPHPHSDHQTRLYCLAERAKEERENSSGMLHAE